MTVTLSCRKDQKNFVTCTVTEFLFLHFLLTCHSYLPVLFPRNIFTFTCVCSDGGNMWLIEGLSTLQDEFKLDLKKWELISSIQSMNLKLYLIQISSGPSHYLVRVKPGGKLNHLNNFIL